jgi:hypothetical protein
MCIRDRNYTQRFNFPITLDKIIKLACLFEVHGLNDCAAELLINRAEEFGFATHLDVLLNALTPSFRGKQLSYKDYIKTFDENPKEWFPSIEGKMNERLFGDASGRSVLVKLLSWGYKLFKKLKKCHP